MRPSWRHKNPSFLRKILSVQFFCPNLRKTLTMQRQRTNRDRLSRFFWRLKFEVAWLFSRWRWRKVPTDYPF